jgi:formylglycine-generating enzyme required for sulfatase activity
MKSFLRCPPERSPAEYHTFRMSLAIKSHFAHPRRWVTVRAFNLMITAVTREQFSLFDPHYEERLEKEGYIQYPRIARCPAIDVNWYDCFVFSKWLGAKFCLPSEAQFEFAFRAGSRGVYYRTDDGRGYCELDMVNDPGGPANQGWGTKLVGLPVSPISRQLFEMRRNVWEWCWDWHSDVWYKQIKKARRPDKAVPADDGAPDGAMRVLRSRGLSGQAAFRNVEWPDSRSSGFGFRVCWLDACSEVT